MSISIIIPTLNEKNNILKLLKLISQNLKNTKYEIIFVDDNSSDGSINIFKKIKSKKINFFIRKKNPDLTQSCFLGIKKSTYNNIIIMDGDLQHNPKYIVKFVKLMKKRRLDIVVGVRDFSKRSSLSIVRFLSSKMIIFFTNNLLGYRTSDPMSGFFLFKKKIFHESNNNMYGKGFKILMDIIYSSKKKLKIRDVKIKFNNRMSWKSKMSFSTLIHIISFIGINSVRKFLFL